MPDRVVCDFCKGDYSDVSDPGGVMTHNSRVGCPRCAPRIAEQDVKVCCVPGHSFADFVRSFRTGEDGQ